MACIFVFASVSAFAEIDPDATITIALTTIHENMDYMISSSLNTASVFHSMYDELIGMNWETAELAPSLATEWSISDDGLVWTFKIRDDVRFHDGTPLTTKDIKYTFERMLVDDYNIGNTNYLNNQIQFDKIVILDDYNFEFHTKVPSPALLYSIHQVHILPEHVYANRTPEEAATLPIVGSGPFKFVEAQKDDFMKVERNDDYWGEKPKYKTLIFRQIPEASTRVSELETSGIDIAQSIPMAQIDVVNNSGVASIKAISNGCIMYFGFNHNNPILTRNVRLAVNHAIDWETINQSFFFGLAPRMRSMVNEPWTNHDFEPYPFDLDKAAAYLEDEGYQKNAAGYWEKDGKELSFNIMVYYEQTSERYEVLLSIVDMLNKFGIKAEPYYLDRAAALEKMDKREIDDLYFIGTCTQYEPQGDLTNLKADSSSNYGRWNNPEFEALMQKLLVEFDTAKRAELAKEMQVIAYEDAATVPLYVLIDTWGVNNKVNWNPSPTGRAWMGDASKEK